MAYREGKREMEGKIFGASFFFFFIMGLAAFKSIKSTASNAEKKGKGTPVISQSFASPSLWLGDTWKVYLNASEPDGDMKYIVCTIAQPGMGTYPVSFTRIKEENRRQLSGYIYLTTRGLYGPNLSNITLTVQIQDRAGNFSNPASFPLLFQQGAKQEAPPVDTYTFQETDLGPIMITLQSSSGGG